MVNSIKNYISYFYKHIQEYNSSQVIYNYQFNSFQAIHDVVASDDKMIVDKQEVHPNCSRSCHGTKLMKSAFNVIDLVWKNNHVILINYKLFQRLSLYEEINP